MGRAGSRLSRLARVRHHPRRTAFTGRPAPHPARPTNPTPPTELTTEPPNRHHTNRISRHRIASQGAGPTSGHIYTGNGTPPRIRVNAGTALILPAPVELVGLGSSSADRVGCQRSRISPGLRGCPSRNSPPRLSRNSPPWAVCLPGVGLAHGFALDPSVGGWKGAHGEEKYLDARFGRVVHPLARG